MQGPEDDKYERKWNSDDRKDVCVHIDCFLSCLEIQIRAFSLLYCFEHQGLKHLPLTLYQLLVTLVHLHALIYNLLLLS